MNQLRYIIFIGLCCSVQSMYAQTPRAFEQAANAAFEAKDYYAAFKYLGKVLEMEPARTDVMVRYADAARLYGAFRDAEQHYEQALQSEHQGAGKYASALLGLAIVKKHLGKYDEALRLFERYTARPDADATGRQKALTEIADCEWAMEKITHPDRLAVLEPMNGAFNTGDSELGILQRGDTMYFGALHLVEWGDKHIPPRPLLQVMMSVQGSAPRPAAFNALKKHTALPAFSSDGRILIIPVGEYAGETEVRCDLYFARFTNGAWSEPVLLPAFINHPEATQTQPHIAARKDGYFDLYYVSDAPGGKGGKDIWKSTFSATGAFNQPENLAAINTVSDEATPYFDEAAQTLYFSSTGYQNLGGYDIYKVKRENNDWKQVKHLPVPVNSSYNDLYYKPQNTQSAFLTSNRIGAAVAGEESCCYDLFQLRYLDLQLQAEVFDEQNKQPLSEVVFTLTEPEARPKTKYVADGNSAQFAIKREREYAVLASKDGYFPDTLLVSSVDLEWHKTTLQGALYLRPMKVDLAVRVFNQFSKEPLSGVNIYLYEQSGHLHDEQQTDAEGNETGLKADYRNGYLIIAQKEGFAPDTMLVSAAEMSQPGAKVIKNLFLTPASLYGLLPLAIYFDNDVPPRAAQDQIRSYTVNYTEYLSRKEEFVREFTKGIADEAEKAKAATRLEAFFESEVKGGYMKLERFAENLDVFLENGYEVEIMIKGFASPLASHEYNLALTRRRIVSVKNYLREAKGGVYQPYLLDKKLLVSTAPLGESLANQSVSDNRKLREQSVFSVEASKERRAEIIEVRLTRHTSNSH